MISLAFRRNYSGLPEAERQRRMKLITRKGGFALGLLFTLAIAVLLIGAACGGGDEPGADQNIEDGEPTGDEADIEAAVQAAADAWNASDVEGYLVHFTDNWILMEFEATREGAAGELAEFVGSPPLAPGELTGIQVSGKTATADANEFTFGALVAPKRMSFIKEAAGWLIDHEEDLPAAIPDGVAAVELTLFEYSFEFDSDAITDSNFAFDVSSIGAEQHELVLIRVPEDLDIQAAILSTEQPAGIEDVGVAGPWNPGTDSTVVFAAPLGPGRYAMLCFIEDANGVPHAVLGMVNEFTIE